MALVNIVNMVRLKGKETNDLYLIAHLLTHAKSIALHCITLHIH